MCLDANEAATALPSLATSESDVPSTTLESLSHKVESSCRFAKANSFIEFLPIPRFSIANLIGIPISQSPMSPSRYPKRKRAEVQYVEEIDSEVSDAEPERTAFKVKSFELLYRTPLTS